MELKVKSAKLKKIFTFYCYPKDSSSKAYVYVDTNSKQGTLGEQICRNGFTNCGSCLMADEKTFESVCKRWLKLHISVVSVIC